MKRLRQFEVTHRATGIVTRVMSWQWRCAKGWSTDYLLAASQLGYRFPVDCTARMIPVAQEIPLPFDEIPLVLRRKG